MFRFAMLYAVGKTSVFLGLITLLDTLEIGAQLGSLESRD